MWFGNVILTYFDTSNWSKIVYLTFKCRAQFLQALFPQPGSHKWMQFPLNSSSILISKNLTKVKMWACVQIPSHPSQCQIPKPMYDHWCQISTSLGTAKSQMPRVCPEDVDVSIWSIHNGNENMTSPKKSAFYPWSALSILLRSAVWVLYTYRLYNDAHDWTKLELCDQQWDE